MITKLSYKITVYTNIQTYHCHHLLLVIMFIHLCKYRMMKPQDDCIVWCTLLVILHLHSIASETPCDLIHFACRTPDGGYGTCASGICTFLNEEVRNNLQVIIEVKYPESNLRAHNGQELFIRGSGLGLSWTKGKQMIRFRKDTWQTTVIYQSESDGFRCKHCSNSTSFVVEFLEYRIYIDDSVDMVGGNLQLKLPLSMTSTYFNDTPVFQAHPWFFSKRGSSSILPTKLPLINKTFNTVIFQPPSFHENPYKTYPTVLVLDLNEKLYNVSSDIINDAIVEKQTIGEFIIVGFGDYDRDSRSSLLSPVDSPAEYFYCANGTRGDNCGGCIPDNPGSFSNYLAYMGNMCGRRGTIMGKGNGTLDFLINTVLPEAKKVTKSRMRIDQPNIGIMGFSLGGLLACHAALTRPNIFGFAACQSPAFFWPLINATHANFFFNNITLKDPSIRYNRPFQRIYLDAGGTETYAPSEVMTAMLNAARELNRTGNFEWDKNLWVNVFPSHTHSFSAWISRLWLPFRIFFPTNAASYSVQINCVSHLT